MINETIQLTERELAQQAYQAGQYASTKACSLQFATENFFGDVSSIICWIINVIRKYIIEGFFISYPEIAVIIIIILIILAILWYRNR